MAEAAMRAPTFEKILSSATNVPEKVIDITFLGADGKKYTVALSATCAPLTLAAIAAHLGELLSTLPAKDHPPLQPIVGKSIETAMRDDGSLALILTLESGAELPLEFPRGDLAKLSAKFADLARIADPGSYH